MITRRGFLLGASTLAIGAALAAQQSHPALQWLGLAQAQTPPSAPPVE